MANEIRSMNGALGDVGSFVSQIQPRMRTQAPTRNDVAQTAKAAKAAARTASAFKARLKVNKKKAQTTKAVAVKLAQRSTVAKAQGKDRKVVAADAIRAAVGTRQAATAMLSTQKQALAAGFAIAGAKKLASAAKLKDRARVAAGRGKTAEAAKLTRAALVASEGGARFVRQGQIVANTQVSVPVPAGISKSAIQKAASQAGLRLRPAVRTGNVKEVKRLQDRIALVVALGGIAGMDGDEMGALAAEAYGFDFDGDSDLDGLGDLGWSIKGALKKAGGAVKGAAGKAVGTALNAAAKGAGAVLPAALGKKLGLAPELIGDLLGAGKPKGGGGAPAPAAAANPEAIATQLAQQSQGGAPAESDFPTAYVAGGVAAALALGVGGYFLMRRAA